MNSSASTVRLKVIENQQRMADSERGVPMYEVQAAAEMPLMTGQAKAAIAPEATAPVETLLVRAVLDGDRDSFSRLYDLFAPMVHGILLSRVPRVEVED